MPRTAIKKTMDLYFEAPLSFRLKRATAVDTKTHYKIMHAFLDLRDRQDAKSNKILQAVYDKVITVRQVWESYPDKLDKLPINSKVYLDPAVYVWCDSYGAKPGNSTATTDRYKQSFKSLLRYSRGSTNDDLPSMLTQYRKRCEDRQEYRAFDVAKCACQSYIRNTMGRNNHLYLAISDFSKLESKPKNPTRALEWSEVLTIMERLPEKYATMFWTLVITGMRTDEYFIDKWELKGDRIHVKGTKTRASNRMIPRVIEPVPHLTTKKHFSAALKKAWPDERISPYITRKTHAKMLRDAGIFGQCRRMYMGHGSETQTEYYELAKNQTKELRADAKLIEAYIKRAGKQTEDTEEDYQPPTVTMPGSNGEGQK